MIMQVTELVSLDDTQVCSAEYLAEASGLSLEEIEDLIDSGVIAPVDTRTQPASFRLRYVVTARTARRLRDDFELNRHGIALALTLLRRIEEMESELSAARARLRQASGHRY
jgi:chaperone modulatory protein CbpM